ncbi:hypothetical protein FOL46_008823 [Perkinsus olseni]|uniref:Uncharacterized protein n=1 Tax=Perkinsus olseni TaxID=32597 RepID=A0A7J6MNI7_PEROL|nr:hypothetical protein FOL46_008823 [Perkinsus olseni]
MSISPSPSPSDTILFHHPSEGHEAAGPAIPAAPQQPQQPSQLPIIPVLPTSERIPTPQQQKSRVMPVRPQAPILPSAPQQQQSLMSTAAQMAAFMNERTRYLATLQQKFQRQPTPPQPKAEFQPLVRAEPPQPAQQQQQPQALDFPVFTDPSELAAKLFKDDGRACKGRGTQVVTECEFKANYGVWTLAGLDRIKSLRSKGYTSAQIYSAVEAAAGIALPMLERLQYLEDAPGSRIAKALTLPGKAASGNAVKHHRGPTKAELMAIWAMLEVRHLNERANEASL